MSHDVQRKNEALKSLESEVEKLQHSLICEKEHTATLGMEQSTLAEQLQKAREQKRHLEAELERCMEEYRAKVAILLLRCMKTLFALRKLAGINYLPVQGREKFPFLCFVL